MTYRHKSVYSWTSKHEEYCLKNQIPESAQRLWKWLLKKGEINTEIEPDLNDFNKWVAKHRVKGAYCNKTLKTAFNKLLESRVINVIKKYTWAVAKLVTRPLEYLEPRKKVRKRDIISTLDASKARKFDDVVYQQQQLNIINNKLLYSEYGIHFNDTDVEVLNIPKNEVLLAITCYQIRDTTRHEWANKVVVKRGKINNPEGFIRMAIRKRLWDEPRMYQQIMNEYAHTTFWFELFPEDTEGMTVLL